VHAQVQERADRAQHQHRGDRERKRFGDCQQQPAAEKRKAGAGTARNRLTRLRAAGERREGVVFLPLDVTDDQSVAAAVSEVLYRSGRIDVLVNNAGVGVSGAAEESSVEQARVLFETNVCGAMRMTRAALPVMRIQGGGRIINVSSLVGLIPVPFMALYASTKHALEGYSQSVDHELREHGIRVLLLEPGFTKTGFDGNLAAADEPIPFYAERRAIVDAGLAEALQGGDDPSIVAEAIVKAATDRRPKLRYAAGRTARRVSNARRYAPSGIFDKQIRKLNRLPA
jgi:NAD(P)-dependent dehydrogenase (short-subunit alcohol dehydrogenase family)